MDCKFINDNTVNSIVNGIKNINSKKSKVISIQGESGSGKSFLIKEVKNALLSDENIKCEYLNCSCFYNTNEAIREIFNKLNKLIKNTMIFRYESNLIAGNTEGNYKNEINNFLVKKNTKLVLFIDDFDMLDAKIVRAIMRIIKGVCNFKNIIYVLSFDEEILTSILTRNFGRKGNLVSKAYIEKIVDIPICIKSESKNELTLKLTNSVETLLKTKNIKFSDEDKNKFFELIKGLYEDKIRSIRMCERYLNVLRFNDIPKDCNIVNYLIVEALKVFYSSVYKKIDVKDECVDEYTIKEAINEYERDGNVKSMEDRALLIEKTVESLLCERE